MPVEDLIRSQLQSEVEFCRPTLFSIEIVYSCKFQTAVGKDMAKALTCRLAQL